MHLRVQRGIAIEAYKWRAELITAPARVQKISDCTAVACGAEFTMWLCDGKLWSAGGSQYGQLGHGTDHEYNAKDCEPSPTIRLCA
jgi:alpha-tubulin suppressor-like RCC1 family protein